MTDLRSAQPLKTAFQDACCVSKIIARPWHRVPLPFACRSPAGFVALHEQSPRPARCFLHALRLYPRIGRAGQVERSMGLQQSVALSRSFSVGVSSELPGAPRLTASKLLYPAGCSS